MLACAWMDILRVEGGLWVWRARGWHEKSPQLDSVTKCQTRSEIERTTTVDEDILASELEERGDVLVNELEAIGLPVSRIIGELEVSLDI